MVGANAGGRGARGPSRAGLGSSHRGRAQGESPRDDLRPAEDMSKAGLELPKLTPIEAVVLLPFVHGGTAVRQPELSWRISV
jgi:hypothetical protein